LTTATTGSGPETLAGPRHGFDNLLEYVGLALPRPSAVRSKLLRRLAHARLQARPLAGHPLGAPRTSPPGLTRARLVQAGGACCCRASATAAFSCSWPSTLVTRSVRIWTSLAPP